MRRVIGMDIHRTFAEVVFWEAGQLRPAGRVRYDPRGAGGLRPQPEQGRRGRHRGDRQRDGGGAGARARMSRG